MDQNYTPQMPMVTPNPVPAPGPEGGTLGGDLLQQNPTPTPAAPAAKKVNKTPIIIVAVVLLLAIIGVVLFFVIQGVTSGNNDTAFVDSAKKLTDAIDKSGKNKVIYLYDDLKELDSDFGKSPYGEDIKKSSYIYYVGNEPTYCITDGKHRVENLNGDLAAKSTAEDCVFELNDQLAADYISAYYTNKGEKVEKNKTKKINSYYEVTTENSTKYAKVIHKDGKISVEEDMQTLGKIETVDEMIAAIQFYFENIMNMKIGSQQEVIEVKKMTDDDFEYAMVQVSVDYNSALQYGENLGKYLSERGCANRKFGIRALVWDDSGIHNSYLVRVSIQDGSYLVDTLQAPSGQHPES